MAMKVPEEVSLKLDNSERGCAAVASSKLVRMLVALRDRLAVTCVVLSCTFPHGAEKGRSVSRSACICGVFIEILVLWRSQANMH